jgi:hypothetical protein
VAAAAPLSAIRPVTSRRLVVSFVFDSTGGV